MSSRHTILALLLTATAQTAMAGTVTQTNLTSDGSIPAPVTDPNLKNPWGISFGPGGAFWVSDNADGLTTLYSGDGSIVPLVVTIPAAAGTTGSGSPSGQVFNATTDFSVSAGGTTAPAVFIFVTEDGTISGWNPSVDHASAVVAALFNDPRSDEARELAAARGAHLLSSLAWAETHAVIARVEREHGLTGALAEAA